MTNQVVLVVGAQPGSVGAAIAKQAWASGHTVYTAGISDHEQHYLDLIGLTVGQLMMTLAALKPDHIVVTAGVNEERRVDEDPYSAYAHHFSVNVTGPMRLLHAWERLLVQGNEERRNRHYVAISSNSARIPRTGSGPYCASKAALSMALRVAAREQAGGRGAGLVVYGYEPGLVAGTPMTTQTRERWPEVRLTRMRPESLYDGLPASSLAWQVVSNLELGWEMSGVLVPLDADEL